jgi:hypothetical protein
MGIRVIVISVDMAYGRGQNSPRTSDTMLNSHHGEHGFTPLSEQFETLTRQLTVSRDPAKRQQILRQLRDVIGRMDSLITTRLQNPPYKDAS